METLKFIEDIISNLNTPAQLVFIVLVWVTFFKDKKYKNKDCEKTVLKFEKQFENIYKRIDEKIGSLTERIDNLYESRN